MRVAFIELIIALAVCASCSGCLQPIYTDQPAPARAVTAPIKADAVKIQLGNEQALEALIAAHKGQVVFVDYWATWCHPCVEYFPHTVAMSRKYKDKGLATIAVSFDAASEESKVREFLASQGADFENILCSYEPGPAAFEGFKVDLVPHFRLYDRAGKLRHKWDARPDDAEQRIEALLAEKDQK